MVTLPSVTLPGSETLPSIGLGTWRMGESASRRAADIAAVRSALDIGYRVIDTAEMYGEGGAETVVGQAIADALRVGTLNRSELFIVSKVYPQNASAAGVAAACERSLKRLGLDHLDAYLLHWRGAVPLAETVAGFESLRDRGRIRHWGVSNFDVDDLEVGPATSADDVEEWDSLSHIRFVITLERLFKIKFRNEEIADLKNVGDLARVIQAKLAA